MYKIWMALSNIVSIATLLNIIKHHRIIIHHDSTTLKSHSTTHIYHRSSAHCLFNIVLQIQGKLTSCYLLKILKRLHEYIAWHTFMKIGEIWQNLTNSTLQIYIGINLSNYSKTIEILPYCTYKLSNRLKR